MSKEKTSSPPEISPYAFPCILAGMGFWCFYDGWFSTDPGIQEYLLFNRIGSIVLLLWATVDFYRTRRFEKQHKAVEPPVQSGD